VIRRVTVAALLALLGTAVHAQGVDIDKVAVCATIKLEK